jgi:hypothetical protein
MDAEVQEFLDKATEKREAKSLALAAVGEAKLAELGGKDASEHWAVVEREGMTSGREGRLAAELQAMADAYVLANPELFVMLEAYVVPEGTAAEQKKAQGELVALAGFLGKNGQPEAAARAVMFELARFPRQQIGSEAHIVYRTPRAGGKG